MTQVDPSGTLSYAWDARNRLTGLTGPTTSAQFAYDGLGRRASKVLNGASTAYQYDGLDAIRETGAGGETTYLRTLAIDEALVRTDSGDPVHFLADALGGTVALTTSDGVPVTTYTYAPFGETRAAGTASTNPVQFTGRENDGTGLYYYRARYYDPTISRFVSEDPLRFESKDVNPYAYVKNSPLLFVDPTGEIIGVLTRLAAQYPRLMRAITLALHLLKPSRPREPVRLPPMSPPAKTAPKDPPYKDPKILLPPILSEGLSPDDLPAAAPVLSGRKPESPDGADTRRPLGPTTTTQWAD